MNAYFAPLHGEHSLQFTMHSQQLHRILYYWSKCQQLS